VFGYSLGVDERDVDAFDKKIGEVRSIATNISKRIDEVKEWINIIKAKIG